MKYYIVFQDESKVEVIQEFSCLNKNDYIKIGSHYHKVMLKEIDIVKNCCSIIIGEAEDD